MGVRELREAFNAIAAPRYQASTATLHYVRAHDAESQVITISGNGSDGNAFEVTSEALRPNTELIPVAQAMAQNLIDKGEPLT